MQVRLSRTSQLGRLALTLSVSLVVLAAIFLVACTDDQVEPTTEYPR